MRRWGNRHLQPLNVMSFFLSFVVRLLGLSRLHARTAEKGLALGGIAGASTLQTQPTVDYLVH